MCSCVEVTGFGRRRSVNIRARCTRSARRATAIDQRAVAGELDQSLVEALVCGRPGLEIVDAKRTRHVARRVDQRLQFRVRRLAQGEDFRRRGFQCRQHRVDFTHVGRRYRKHAHAVPRHDGDQSLVGEADQRLANGRAADAQRGGKLAFQRLVTRRKHVVEDAPADGLVGILRPVTLGRVARAPQAVPWAGALPRADGRS